jgi:hypothetical protein
MRSDQAALGNCNYKRFGNVSSLHLSELNATSDLAFQKLSTLTKVRWLRARHHALPASQMAPCKIAPG